MPNVITHLIYYSITIQVVVLAFGFKEKKWKGVWKGEGMLFVLNYFKQSYTPSYVKYDKSVPETTVMPYWNI